MVPGTLGSNACDRTFSDLFLKFAINFESQFNLVSTFGLYDIDRIHVANFNAKNLHNTAWSQPLNLVETNLEVIFGFENTVSAEGQHRDDE